jgi:hypothetical protein
MAVYSDFVLNRSAQKHDRSQTSSQVSFDPRTGKQRKNFPDSGGKQRPIVSTLVHAIIRFLAGASGVLHMDLIVEIRRRHLVSKGEHQFDRA